jgi:hypothetical protein
MKSSIGSGTRVWQGLIVLATAAALLLLSGKFAVAADGRDAPTPSLNSAIDINDLYLFRDPPDSTGVGASFVVALTTQPFANPAAGGTYHFQPNALYRLNFSTTPDAIASGTPTATIDFVFSAFGNGAACPAPGEPCQTYTAYFPDGTVINGLATQGTSAATPLSPIVTTAGRIKVFAGPREDPFFFDLVGFNRFITDLNSQATPPVPNFNLFTGRDAYAGSNVNAIVIQFPISMLLAGGSGQLAVWASTYLLPPHTDSELRQALRDPTGPSGKRILANQIDREGNPLVNTGLIPQALNDAFDFGQPQNDARDFGAVITGNLTRYGVDPTVLPLLTNALIPNTLKFNTALPDGYLNVPPNGRQLTDRTTDFLLTLAFNVNVPTHAVTPCPAAQTIFSDCTAPKVPQGAFPFLGPPLQPTP